jgi:TolA-binding protein
MKLDREDAALIAIAKSLPYDELARPADLRAELVILARGTVQAEPRDHRARWAIAAVLVIAGLGALSARLWSNAPSATIVASAEADFDREVRSSTIERVTLRSGKLTIDGATPVEVSIGVATLRIEARAEIRADGGEIEAIWVQQGTVELRRLGAVTVLQTGERWSKASPPAAHLEAVAAPALDTADAPRALKLVPRRRAEEKITETTSLEAPLAPVKTAPPPIAAHEGESPDETPPIEPTPTEPTPIAKVSAVPETPAPTDAEAEFAAGWAAYRAGRPAVAAEHFARCAIAEPEGPFAEDARYFLGIAHKRSGHTREAETALRAFLEAHPRSRRAGEIRVTLGWLLLESDRDLEARRMFKIAAEDPSPEIRESAQRGYEATE